MDIKLEWENDDFYEDMKPIVPKCFVEDKTIEKKHEVCIFIVSDTTFLLILDEVMNLLYNVRMLHCVGEDDTIYYEWKYETLERNVPLPQDKRRCYERGRISVRYTVIRAKSEDDIFEKNLDMLKSGLFGNLGEPETLVAYWKAQAVAGCPYAIENVKYYEGMIRNGEKANET